MSEVGSGAGRKWRNCTTGQELVETGERKGALITLTVGDTDRKVVMHADDLNTLEWRVTYRPGNSLEPSPVVPSAEDFRIRLCKGTTDELIAERMAEDRVIALGVTDSMVIYLSHHTSHWDILADAGVHEFDLVCLGNVSLGVGLYARGGRHACVRLKADDFWKWHAAIDAAVDSYCKPIAEEYRRKARQAGATESKP